MTRIYCVKLTLLRMWRVIGKEILLEVETAAILMRRKTRTKTETGDLDADAAVDFEGNDMGSDLDTTHETPGITTVQSCTLMRTMSEQHVSEAVLVTASHGCVPVAFAADFEHTEAGGQSGPSEHRWRDLENQRLEQARQVGVLDLSTPSPRSTDGTPLSSRYSITPTPTTPPRAAGRPRSRVTRHLPSVTLQDATGILSAQQRMQDLRVLRDKFEEVGVVKQILSHSDLLLKVQGLHRTGPQRAADAAAAGRQDHERHIRLQQLNQRAALSNSTRIEPRPGSDKDYGCEHETESYVTDKLLRTNKKPNAQDEGLGLVVVGSCKDPAPHTRMK
ncbi:hypothetical protein PF010_g11003 [Phytophthora fragariae]|uniref:Uncharacterized protein n=1 Tax=Phytophthora fragariae TaxID=53985 RepID=A0A6A3U285_9STRA|nr:hypothetical protein PF011_g9186 [Phytophthora fragariae]KAE9110925.1 hypothetical protein PF010_g11003 [Phytophthora fragariae]KAE9145432.1 hypothetical protein PF006_g9714 [Phytophthora fragariae]